MKNTLNLIILMAALMTACGVNLAIETDTEKIDSAAAEITSFELPAGYRSEFSANLNEYTLVSYTPGDGYSHLYLVQSKNAADTDKLLRAMQEIIPGQYDPDARMTVLETRPVTVRGQETTLVISEGINSDGKTYRQALVAFDGNDGPALLVFSTSVTSWDLVVVETVVASIRQESE
jgi:hypothetical protein